MQNWILPNVKMPEMNQVVLVTYKDHVYTGKYNGDYWTFCLYNSHARLAKSEDIIAWMPLPNTYSLETNSYTIEHVKKLIDGFNQSIPSDSFFEDCKKSGELFEDQSDK